jgi:hypothetical protein
MLVKEGINMQPTAWPLFKRRVAYVFAPRLAWLAVLWGAFTLLLVFNVRHEPCIRWWGMLLQLVGVLAVLIELLHVSERYELGPLKWWKEFREDWPSGTQRISAATGGAKGSGSTAILSTMIVDGGDTARIEARVAVLESQVKSAFTNIDSIHAELATQERNLRDSVAREREERERQQAKLADESRNAEKKKLPFSFFGVCCLLVGVILGTGSNEIAKWLN